MRDALEVSAPACRPAAEIMLTCRGSEWSGGKHQLGLTFFPVTAAVPSGDGVCFVIMNTSQCFRFKPIHSLICRTEKEEEVKGGSWQSVAPVE